AIQVLDRWLATGRPAERLLAEWGRANRYAGSGDRRAIADLVYDAIRRKRSAAWTSGSGTGRGLVHGSMLIDGTSPDTVFTGALHAPEALSLLEQNRSASVSEAPWGVRVDLPDWLERHLGAFPEPTLRALGARAPLDLRVNRLKSDLPAARAALDAARISTEARSGRPDFLRVTGGAHLVQHSAPYLDGLVEIQDASSQAAAAFAAARAGERVLDLCAGGGGKALALAADLENRGRLFVHDVSAERLAQLPDRAERAGADVELVGTKELTGLKRSLDLVFVDAPCSGSGTWRRSPEAKWAFTPDRLVELIGLQNELLETGLRLIRPGGRLVYVTCSLIAEENAARVNRLLNLHPHLSIESTLTLDNLDDGDGFFAARIVTTQ
ncbi:MAG: RsmB/NOP family class I SAM-dependent RNA methyltransferase, partial [Pseudomonadota bacterium]